MSVRYVVELAESKIAIEIIFNLLGVGHCAKAMTLTTYKIGVF